MGPEKGTTSFEISTESTSFNRDSSSLDPRNMFDVEANTIKEIADFLAKPIVVGSGSFTTTNIWGDNLFTGDIKALFNAQSLWVNKIQGYLSFRGDVKLRIVVNATPFQAGLLRLGYFPCGDFMTSESSMHRYNRMTVSQLPGTYLDLHDSSVEVTIPYLAPATFFERDVPTAPTWGRFYLDVFEVLRTGTGPTTVNFTIWMSIENVELSGQTVPQMASMPRRRTRKVNITDAESNDGKGPITRILSSGANLASDIMNIPVLTGIATPAFWALRAASAAAETLGWSKPTITSSASRFIRTSGSNQQNSDGGDDAIPLALSADNKVAIILDAAPADQDEMSFRYIQSVWSYWFDFQWATALAAGTVLASASLSPLQMRSGGVVGTRPVTTVTPCAAAGLFMKYYRGGFDVKVKVVKTGFHSGTLAISYLPGKTVVTLPAYADTSYLFRSIIDIQDANEFTFRFPYILPQDYLDISEQIGQIVIHVVNPLLAPATVSSTVDVMILVKGAPDLQYQAITDFSWSPAVAQMADDIEVQGVDVEPEGSIDREFGVKSQDVEPIHHAQQSIGEYTASVLSIAKTYHRLLSSDNTGFPLDTRNLSVFSHRYTGTAWNGTIWTQAEMGGDFINLIASWYAFSRGSMRFRYNYVRPTNSGTVAKATYIPILTSYSNSSISKAAALVNFNGTLSNYSARVTSAPIDNGAFAVQAPFYSKYRYMLNQFDYTTGTGTKEYMPNYGVTFDLDGSNRFLTRSAGDDFQFSFFVGIPALVPSPYS